MATNPTVVNLATLNGRNGFRIDGIDANDASGAPVSSAGDVNGDGYDDILVGANRGDPGGDSNAGESYVIFGKPGGFAASLDLATLDGVSGFRIDGIDASDYSGRAVSSAGDVNGDGFGDILIGAYGADIGGDGQVGESYIIFGKASGFGSAFDLSTLDGSNGFRIEGIGASDFSGLTVSGAGDVNGDGFDDFLIGASFGDPGNDLNAGESYLVFGKAGGFAPVLDLAGLNGNNGFRIDGIDVGEYSGRALASAGDINGDGFDDIIIGAYGGDPGGRNDAGDCYVIFGKASGFTAAFDPATLSGFNGFRIEGLDSLDKLGRAVASAGDVNGDGFDDILIGAYGGDPGISNAGESYLIFGKASGFAANLDLASLNGSNGFRITGISTYDYSGSAVSSAGDVNGDGFDDILIGASRASAAGDDLAGESYVIFGKSGSFGTSFSLANLNGTNGFRIDGIDFNDRSGGSVAAAGDINNDGFDDIIIGASGGDPGGDNAAGESYVIFGRATAVVNRTGTSVADRLFGGDFNDTLSGAGGNDFVSAGDGNDVLNGSTGKDVLVGGKGRDTLTGGTSSDDFRFARGDSGQTTANMDRITDFAKGAVNVGDEFDFSAILTVGGAAAVATATRASINQTTGIATFAAGSGNNLTDALNDIATRMTLSTDTLGEFALFRVGGTGAFHIFVSDGVAGVTANDVLVQLTGVTTIGAINLAGGDLTILT